MAGSPRVDWLVSFVYTETHWSSGRITGNELRSIDMTATTILDAMGDPFRDVWMTCDESV
jgi:hypothetical protein